MVKLKQLYPGSVIQRKSPLNLAEADKDCFGQYSYELPPVFLYSIPNVLVTDEGILLKYFRPLARFINCYRFDFIHYANRYFFHILLRKKKVSTDQKQKYLLGFDNYSGPQGFAHWISDGLTRLVELNEFFPDHTVLLPDYMQSDQMYVQSLACFNIPRVRYLPKGTYTRIKSLCVADFIADSGNYRPENVVKLRNWVWNKLEIHHTKGHGDLLYISRAKAKRRFIINEEEISAYLIKKGFKVIFMEDYSFSQQVAMAYHAKVVVSLHGASLTCMHFMKEGSAALEFRKEADKTNNMYFSLADASGVHYYYQFCKARVHALSANNFDLLVDKTKLETNINLILAQTR
jgi:hypothetical protein